MRLMPAFVRMNASINKINFQFSIVNGIEKNKPFKRKSNN